MFTRPRGPDPWFRDSPADEVSKRSPATVIQAWVLLAYTVIHWPMPGDPQDINGPEAIGLRRIPAAWST
jgi:hypothetical protein